LVVIDDALIERALAASRASPRGRVILPFHQSHDEVCHRMLNAVQPGSYVRPHRHVTPPKPESVVVLRGAIRFVTFSDEGQVRKRFTCQFGRGPIGVDVRPGVFHTFFALEPDTVVFEAKPGPYDATSDKEFAPWAPAEGSPDAAQYLERLSSEQLFGAGPRSG
jgi:cupin fold WbuC family metalloprotein